MPTSLFFPPISGLANFKADISDPAAIATGGAR